MGGDRGDDAPETAESPQPEAETQAPAAEAPQPEAPQAEAPAEGQPAAEGQSRSGRPPAPVSPPRVAAAIQRVGGPEVVWEALAPKRDDEGEPLKWAEVCCRASQGVQPGDPVFLAWVRLAATPVREVKSQLRALAPDRDDGRRDGRRGGRRGGRRDDRPRSGGGGGGADRVDLSALARDGSLRTRVRITNDETSDRREREQRRKAERDAKRQAERERLERLGL